ncbi:MAG: DNA mismatch repair endonuclease MutL [Candidatus Shikimatogenerans bostrichidophilus]|nr:MAG: DNA mismatch repair endonuclease MutL [Candidatus Shikimatogenerans bostrichidophilus]
MKNIIKFLPEKILNKISSGETIKNYSSIVKELVENSIDAKSKNISINIDNFTDCITVIDDGYGMLYNDAIISFKNGTTSKIKKIDDLFNIKTIGYRGNALYSISSISIMEIITKHKLSKIGFKIIIEYGKIIKKIPFVCNNGSCFIIKNIFYNIPQKKKFLLSKEYEFNKIIKDLYKIMICYNKINFKLYNNKKLIFNLNKSSLIDRIYNIFLKKIKFKKDLFLNFKKKKKIKLKFYFFNKKYINFFKSKKIKIKYIFINNRYIKNIEYYKIINNLLYKYINIKNLIYLIFLKINNKYININILPNKTKIQIKNNKYVKQFIICCFKKFFNFIFFFIYKIFIYFFFIYKIIFIKKFFVFKKKYKNQILLIPIKFNIPYFISNKQIKFLFFFLKKKIKIIIKKRIIYIYSIPYFLDNSIIIELFNNIFINIKEKKTKINIKKIILILFSKLIYKKDNIINILNINSFLYKLFNYKNFLFSPSKKKIFFFKKKHIL